MQEMTPRAKDSLVSFGERLSSRLFAGYLDRLGVKGTQFDAWDLGMQTTDEFTNAEIIYELSLPAVGKALKAHVREHGTVPVVTGFVGKAASSGKVPPISCMHQIVLGLVLALVAFAASHSISCHAMFVSHGSSLAAGAITTLGRGGSDLTATFLGAALGVSEVVVWKDVNGVLSADPRIVRDARVINELTFDEATELAYFGAQACDPAYSCACSCIVKCMMMDANAPHRTSVLYECKERVSLPAIGQFKDRINRSTYDQRRSCRSSTHPPCFLHSKEPVTWQSGFAIHTT